MKFWKWSTSSSKLTHFKGILEIKLFSELHNSAYFRDRGRDIYGVKTFFILHGTSDSTHSRSNKVGPFFSTTCDCQYILSNLHFSGLSKVYNFKNQKVRCWGIPSQKYQNRKSWDGHSRIWTCARLPGIDFKSIVLGHSTMCPFIKLRRSHLFSKKTIYISSHYFLSVFSFNLYFAYENCNGLFGKRGKKMVFSPTWLA